MDRGNPVNLRVGSEMQQAHGAQEEEAVEVVRNHEDGTSGARGSVLPKPGPKARVGVDSSVCVDGEGSLENPEGAAWQQAERREMQLQS